MFKYLDKFARLFSSVCARDDCCHVCVQIEEVAGLQVQQVGVDECLEERRHCEGSCTTRLEVGAGEVVNANTTVLVGVRVAVVAECLCSALDYTRPESCRARPCYNGGRCVEGRFGIRYLI